MVDVMRKSLDINGSVYLHVDIDYCKECKTANMQILAAKGGKSEIDKLKMSSISLLVVNSLDNLMNNCSFTNETFASKQYNQPIIELQSVILFSPTT